MRHDTCILLLVCFVFSFAETSTHPVGTSALLQDLQPCSDAVSSVCPIRENGGARRYFDLRTK